MKYFKSILSLLVLALVIGSVFNFLDHGSIFPRQPSATTQFSRANCEVEIKRSFVEKAKKDNLSIDYAKLDYSIKQVCNCARNT